MSSYLTDRILSSHLAQALCTTFVPKDTSASAAMLRSYLVTGELLPPGHQAPTETARGSADH
jgi:hypothetical protein